MEPDWLHDREMKAWIKEMLGTIREDARAALDEKEAVRRAVELEKLIRTGEVSPSDIESGDDSKDVLCALVYRVLPDGQGDLEEETARRLAHTFIEGIEWGDDDVSEKRELMDECLNGGLRNRGESPKPEASPSVAPTDAPTSSGTLQGPEPDGQAEMRSVFEQKVPIIHATLVELHGLTDVDASGLEQELLSWFLRFCRREAGKVRDPHALLLAGALQLGRHHERAKADPDTAENERVSRLVETALYEIARGGATHDRS